MKMEGDIKMITEQIIRESVGKIIIIGIVLLVWWYVSYGVKIQVAYKLL